MCLVDATTFEMYLKNMGQLMMEKITNCDMLIFNRCNEELRKALRGRNLRMVNRRADIYLENTDGTTTHIPYGRELYPGESFFRTDQKVYSRTALSYRRSFFNDTVSVRAEFAAHHDGTALGTQQMLVVGVKLLKTVYNSKNHKK